MPKLTNPDSVEVSRALAVGVAIDEAYIVIAEHLQGGVTVIIYTICIGATVINQ